MKKLWKPLRNLVAALVLIFPCITLGILVGAWFGGNYAENVQFNGVRGYEATGQIGMLVTIFVLLLLSAFYYVKKNRNHRE
jgi:predicted MFS family arabinose efflux permease